MEIKDLQPRQGKVDIILDVVEIGAAREFNKFGTSGKVGTAVGRDSSGEVKLSLWNEQLDQVHVGDKIKISNGWVSEYQGEMQLSTGKFGKLEVIEKAEGMDSQQPISGSPTSSPASPPSKSNSDESYDDNDLIEEIDIEEEDIR